MEQYPFDEKYLARLKARDRETEGHFIEYFNTILKNKLRGDGYSETDVHRIRQETLYRLLKAIYANKVDHPKSLRSFAYGVCARVCWEHEAPQEDPREIAVEGATEVEVADFETRSAVRRILERLPEKERKILVALFIDERNKDEICQEFGIGRAYLRVLIHRALLNIKKKLADSALREHAT